MYGFECIGREILIDLDDTVFDFRLAFEGYNDVEFNSYDNQVELVYYDLDKYQPMYDHMTRHHSTYEHLSPLPGAVEFINKLYRLGFNIIFITAREKIHTEVSLLSLNNIGLNFNVFDIENYYIGLNGYLLCIGDWKNSDKEGYLDIFNSRLLIDDHIKYKNTLDSRIYRINPDNSKNEYSKLFYRCLRIHNELNDELLNLTKEI